MSASDDSQSSGKPTAATTQRTGIVENSTTASIITTAALLAGHCLVTVLFRAGYLNDPDKSSSIFLGDVLFARLPLGVMAIYLQRWLTGSREISPLLNTFWSLLVVPLAYMDGRIGV